MTSKTQTPGSLTAFQPFFAAREKDDQSSHLNRQLIGVLGFMLPILLWIIAGLRPMEGLERWELLGSVSAYYYTGAVGVFVGVLVALGVFLVTYRGYDNKDNRLDRIAGIIAGIAAMGVAFFPTEAPLDILKPTWWVPITGKIHYGCAFVLFGSFIVFSIFLFPKSKIKKGEPLASDKGKRNIFYYFFGGGMLACMVWILMIRVFFDGSIFWPEATALEFFALSWLLKGRAGWTLVSAGKRTLHYGRHPGQLAVKIWRAIRG